MPITTHFPAFLSRWQSPGGVKRTNDQLLEKLVAFNHQRAAEEKAGTIKYLRPEYQSPTTPKK